MTDPLDALIVAHGQPSDPDPAEQALAQLAAQVQARLPGRAVGSATLAAPGALERAAARLRPEGRVYPLFMAAGWFVGRVLPKRLAGHPAEIATPLGLDPGLPALAAQVLRDEAGRRGWTPAQTHVLLAAHGSARGDLAARAAWAFAEALRGEVADMAITAGFVEQAPGIAETAKALPETAICLPFFAAGGGHYLEDIPQALDEAGFGGLRLPPIGQHPQVPDLIAAALTV